MPQPASPETQQTESAPTPPTADARERKLWAQAEREAIAALKVFVAAYERGADPVGDSDLYDEQPRAVYVTLGDCRRAVRALGKVQS